MAFELSVESEKLFDELITRYPTKRAACIPLLHLCQRDRSWVGDEVIGYVSQRLEMDPSEVKGVVTFYTMFQQRPVAPNLIWVCRTLSCELRGGRALQEHLEKRLGCKPGGTSKDGKFTLLTAECLAACGQGPTVQINHQYYEDMTTEKLDQLLDEYATNTTAGGQFRLQG
jgi:NADH-quinone oxidoreductase subunit E